MNNLETKISPLVENTLEDLQLELKEVWPKFDPLEKKLNESLLFTRTTLDLIKSDYSSPDAPKLLQRADAVQKEVKDLMSLMRSYNIISAQIVADMEKVLNETAP